MKEVTAYSNLIIVAQEEQSFLFCSSGGGDFRVSKIERTRDRHFLAVVVLSSPVSTQLDGLLFTFLVVRTQFCCQVVHLLYPLFVQRICFSITGIAMTG